MEWFQSFLGPLKIRSITGGECIFSVQAYAVDKPRGKGDGKSTLRNKLDMDNFHCCDYIYVEDNEEGRVLLIEDGNLKAKKNSLEVEYSNLKDEKARNKIIEKLIIGEQKLKAYASLLLKSRLILKDSEIGQLLKEKPIHFWIIINDGDTSDSRAFDYLSSNLKSTLRPIISSVKVLTCENVKDKFRSGP